MYGVGCGVVLRGVVFCGGVLVCGVWCWGGVYVCGEGWDSIIVVFYYTPKSQK